MRFYWSVCSLNKRFYYFHVLVHGPARSGSELRNWFIKHRYCMALCSVYFCVWIPYLHHFTCLNHFCACFLPTLLIIQYSNPSAFSYWNFDLVSVLLSFLMRVMTSISYTSSLLTIFITITGYLQCSWSYVSFRNHSLCYLNIISCKMNFIFFNISWFIEWSTLY